MKRKYYRDAGFFILGTFLGGWALGLVSGIFGGALGGFRKRG